MPLPKFRGKKSKKNCRKYISKVIEIEMAHGKPQKQSVAIAYSEARKRHCKL